MTQIIDISMDGCFKRRCPCGRWINCRIYKDVYIKKWKHYHDNQFTKEIRDWYEFNFRIDNKMIDTIPNG